MFRRAMPPGARRWLPREMLKGVLLLELLADLHRSVPYMQMDVPCLYRLTEVDYG